VTRLRKLMLDELQRRNYAKNTVRSCIHAVEDFAKYFHRSPDRLGPEHLASIRFIYFETASSHRVRSKAALPPCDFCSSRH
jgi:hypothetical protein